MSTCIISDRICIDCGECDLCDQDPSKVCDNCFACIEEETLDYISIPVVLSVNTKKKRIVNASLPRKIVR